MQRTIRDLLTRVEGLLQRADQQSVEDTKTELGAIRVALKGLLALLQARRSD
jgi:hypothetical protein